MSTSFKICFFCSKWIYKNILYNQILREWRNCPIHYYNTNGILTWIHVYANCIIPVHNFLPNIVARGSNAAATPCSSIAESSWRAQFINLTTRSNCWCSNIAFVPQTCWASSLQKASLACFDCKALNTAGNVFLASDILFSKMQVIQLRKTCKIFV